MTILERLRAATGPDWKLDVAIENELGLAQYASPHPFRASMEGDTRLPVPRFTASIDAALELVGRMLPGWACGFDAGPKTHIGFVDPHDFQDRIFGARYTAEAATPALAILTALFSALEAKEKKDAVESR